MRQLIIALLLIAPVLSIGKPAAIQGFGLLVGSEGNGFSYRAYVRPQPSWAAGGKITLFDIKADDEFVFYNYYTQQAESVGDRYLLIIPIFGFINYFPFEGKIANNLSPYISLQAGPLITLDGDENNDRFFNRWTTADSYFTFGGNINLGVSFVWVGGTSIAVSAGYDIFPMRVKVDGKSRYDGLTLEFSFTRPLR
ncbi:MAG: hypothetical protein ACE5D8_09965 [Fidelibacterota bacterium]